MLLTTALLPSTFTPLDIYISRGGADASSDESSSMDGSRLSCLSCASGRNTVRHRPRRTWLSTSDGICIGQGSRQRPLRMRGSKTEVRQFSRSRGSRSIRIWPATIRANGVGSRRRRRGFAGSRRRPRPRRAIAAATRTAARSLVSRVGILLSVYLRTASPPHGLV